MSSTRMVPARETASRGRLLVSACGGDKMTSGAAELFLSYSAVHGPTARHRNIAERCPGVQTNNRAELIVRLSCVVSLALC